MIAVAILGTATKLKTIRNIALSGAVKGNANFDGSGNVEINTTQNNIFVLSGSVYIEPVTEVGGSSGANVTINYPSGCNADNCVPIACGVKYTTKGYNYVGIYQDAMDSFLNAFKRTLTLTPDNIILRINNPATDSGHTFYYKIILMKIN